MIDLNKRILFLDAKSMLVLFIAYYSLKNKTIEDILFSNIFCLESNLFVLNNATKSKQKDSINTNLAYGGFTSF